MIVLDVLDRRVENPVVDEDDIVFGCVGRMRLVEDGAVLFEEPEFPFVELAIQLKKWSSEGLADGVEFASSSVFTEEVGWVSVLHDRSGWRFDSIHRETAPKGGLSTGEVLVVVERFFDETRAWVQANLGADVADFREMGGSAAGGGR